MDFLEDIFNSIQNLLFPIEDGTTPTEQTVASQNINPINFDITAKLSVDPPLVDIIRNNVENEPPPAAVKNMISKFLDTLASTSDEEIKSRYDEASITPSITSSDFLDPGQKVINDMIDMAEETIEIVHEAVIIPLKNDNETSSTTIKNLSDAFKDSLNDTSSEVLLKPLNDGTSYFDIYIIAALSLLILIAICAGIIVWCRKNKLKSVKRNAGEYPIVTEYMNNKALNNTGKLKNMP